MQAGGMAGRGDEAYHYYRLINPSGYLASDST
jgi:cellobiose phosphorylase